MADDHPLMQMTLFQVRDLVTTLEERYRTWLPLAGASTIHTPASLLTLADLAAIRASLQRSVVHLDRLLVDWDQQQR